MGEMEKCDGQVLRKITFPAYFLWPSAIDPDPDIF